MFSTETSACTLRVFTVGYQSPPTSCFSPTVSKFSSIVNTTAPFGLIRYGVAPDHPRIGPAPTIEQFEAEQHLAVAVETGHRTFASRLHDLGITWKVAVTVPSFSALPMVLAGTELLSYAPAAVARRFEASGVLRVFDLPFDLPASESALYTMRRELPSAEMDWFRTCLIDALSH